MNNRDMREMLARVIARNPELPVYFVAQEEDGKPVGEGIYGEVFFDGAIIDANAEVCVYDGWTFFDRMELREWLIKAAARCGDDAANVDRVVDEAEFTPAIVVYLDC